MIQVNAKDLTEVQEMVKQFNKAGLMTQVVEVYKRVNDKEYNFKILVGN